MRHRALSRDCRAAAAFEFALVLPLFVLCVLGLIEFARAIWIMATLDYAVEAAARCAGVNAAVCGTTLQIRRYAAGAAPGLAVDASLFTVDTLSCGVRVSVSFPLRLGIPGLSVTALTLSAQACYPVLG